MANQHVIGTGKRMLGNSGGVNQGAASRATRMYAHLSPSTSSTKDNKVTSPSTLGTKASTMSISSSNDISKFTSGISMHHPYKERGGAFDQTKQDFQGNPDSRSNFRTPSGGGTSKKGSGSATMRETRAPAPYDDPMKENTMPSDPSKKGGKPSGPKGGTRALMNNMKKAGVNTMKRR